jgi:OOP family OmpA-OmpF porin
MKQAVALKMLVALSGLSFALGVAAQSSDTAAAPAVQKVHVKGIARFDFDKATVNPDDGTKLMTEVRSMKNVTWQTINVVGHTDSVGPEAYNQNLSERRAEAVQAYLIEKGVKPERIKTGGKGELFPIATNKTAAGRAENRRTEIEFLGVQSLAQMN